MTVVSFDEVQIHPLAQSDDAGTAVLYKMEADIEEGLVMNPE